MFQPNISMTQRILRFILGFFLIAWAVAGGEAWAYSGVYLLATGSWGFCLLTSWVRRKEVRLYEDI